ncbi:MAG: C-terminal binding protein [Chloroflexi bacterium]|nr:C-terminal binding protein [Chloroflexota bacterium]
MTPILAVHSDSPPEFIANSAEAKTLGAHGVSVTGKRCASDADLIELAKDAHIILNGLVPITRKAMENLPKTIAVARYGVGYDNVDIAAATEHGIAVIYVPDYCAEEVSNSVFAFLIAFAKQLIPMDAAVHKGQWPLRDFIPKIRSIQQERLGVIGLGRIGMAVAQKGKAFAMDVVAYDAVLKPEQIAAKGMKPVSFDELLSTSDYISLNVPLLPSTRRLIGREQFAKMKKTCFLINTARGPVVDEAALIEALKSGRIAGAGLDVFEKEPLPPDSPLVSMPNVLMTPHSGSQSPVANARLRKQLCEEVLRALRGEWPLNIANPDVKPRARLFKRTLP